MLLNTILILLPLISQDINRFLRDASKSNIEVIQDELSNIHIDDNTFIGGEDKIMFALLVIMNDLYC